MNLTDVYGFNLVLIFLNTILALVIALISGKVHEIIHAIKAKQLGYKINNISLWKNEVDIAIDESDKNNKYIKRAPYIVMFPVGVIVIAVGYYMWTLYNPYFFGTIVGGIAIIFLHLLSFRFEGKDVNKEMFKM